MATQPCRRRRQLLNKYLASTIVGKSAVLVQEGDGLCSVTMAPEGCSSDKDASDTTICRGVWTINKRARRGKRGDRGMQQRGYRYQSSIYDRNH